MKRFALLPLVCFALLLAYAGYAMFVTGHWPYYNHPDPKQLPNSALFKMVGVAFLGGARSRVVRPCGYAVWRFAVERKHQAVPKHGAWVMLYLAGASVWIVDFAALHGRLPWHSVLGWLVD